MDIEINNLIVEKLKSTTIDCPHCESVEDDQYTCTACWTHGGNGKINVYGYLSENKLIINLEKQE